MMGFPSFLLALFLVSHLLVLHSSGFCPPSFNCSGPLDPIKIPHTNYTRSLYGLCTVSCDEPDPKVIWKGIPYPDSNTTPGTIKINDSALKTLIQSNSCDFSSYIPTFYNNPSSVSFTISPSLTIFKCNTSSHKLRWEADEYFRDNHDRYDGCEGGGYTVYYSHPNDQVDQDPTRGSHLPNCHRFQLPSVEEEGDPPSDLFSLLTSDFFVEYHLSDECLKCRDDDGGLCLRHLRECSNETGGRSRMVWILGTVVPAVGIMVILLFCIIIKKLSKTESTFFWEKKTENYRNVEAFIKNCGSLSPKRYTYSDIKKITNSFRTKIGQGGFGCVFKGKLENDCLVAVKVLQGLKGNGEEFINEVATISRTSHVNIVTLLGFCFEGCHRALIYEFMPSGSLDKFIHDGGASTYRQLGWEAMYRIAIGIARGLEYLHRGCNTRILHFDIKPHNILLNEDFCPKISDFGLAKLCPQKVSIISLTGARGTAGYIAPEVFCRNFGGVSHKSDVYSYGMMVLEMVGGRKNISVEVDRTSEIYFPHWVYKRLELDEELGLHGIMDGEANASARKMIIVGLWCIQTDPSNRPSMSRVVEMLEGSTESLQIPPKPYLSSPSRAPVDSSTTHVMTFL
ncbi:rust resistance kinase Lr10-like isoform X3 [Rhododendron vialii]|uniref:rust resistance kinase Lr10-like isoform X3 n=1 Tax=Rhododendron vialii TaxID=182163 RepID=UPI00265E025A|nr:rust resistance kinase Lr10-like isoform X3 [Rhododendron vialii]